MDSLVGDRVVHPSLDVRVFGRPKVDEHGGKVGGALRLDGSGQYASLGRHHDACLGNLDLCRHGLLLVGWLRPGTLRDGMDLLSTGANGVRLRYVGGGQTRVTARTSTRVWTAQTDAIRPDRWQFVEVDWTDEAGLAVYVDNQLVAQASRATVRPADGALSPSSEHEQFFLGRGDGTLANSRYGNMTIDELEYWYAGRDYLLAFDYIQRGLACLQYWKN